MPITSSAFPATANKTKKKRKNLVALAFLPLGKPWLFAETLQSVWCKGIPCYHTSIWSSADSQPSSGSDVSAVCGCLVLNPSCSTRGVQWCQGCGCSCHSLSAPLPLPYHCWGKRQWCLARWDTDGVCQHLAPGSCLKVNNVFSLWCWTGGLVLGSGGGWRQRGRLVEGRHWVRICHSSLPPAAQVLLAHPLWGLSLLSASSGQLMSNNIMF